MDRWCVYHNGNDFAKKLLVFVDNGTTSLLKFCVPTSHAIKQFRQDILDVFIKELNANAGFFAYIDQNEDDFECIVTSGYANEYEWLGKLKYGKGILSKVLKTREVEFTPDVTKDHDYVSVNPHTKSQLTIPLIDRNGVFAVIGAEYLSCNHALNGFDNNCNYIKKFGEELSCRLSCILENFRAEVLAGRLSNVHEIISGTSTYTDEQKRLQCIMSAASNIVSEGAVVILRRYGGILRVIYNENVAPPFPQNLDIGLDKQHGAVCYAAQKQKPVYISDTNDSEKYFFYRRVIDSTRSQYTIPLIYGNELIGVFNIESKYPYGFLRIDRDILDIYAKYLAGVLYNSRIVQDLFTVCHAVNENLRYITFVEPIVETLPEGTQRSHIRHLCDAAKEARAWTSSTTSPLVSEERKPTDICSLTNEVVTSLSNIFSSNNIEVTTSYELSKNIRIVVSLTQIQLVLENLIWNTINSFKKSHQNKQINISVEFCETQGINYIKIPIISNKGKLPVKDVADFFKPRFVWDVKRDDAKPGISIWMCDRLLANNGGYLDIHSNIQDGITMTMWLRV